MHINSQIKWTSPFPIRPFQLVLVAIEIFKMLNICFFSLLLSSLMLPFSSSDATFEVIYRVCNSLNSYLFEWDSYTDDTTCVMTSIQWTWLTNHFFVILLSSAFIHIYAHTERETHSFNITKLRNSEQYLIFDDFFFSFLVKRFRFFTGCYWGCSL